MSKRHNIDEIFRNGLEQHEVPPPRKIWDNIEENLPEPLWYQKPEYKRAAAGLALLFLGWFSGVMTYSYLLNNSKSTNLITKNSGLNSLDGEEVYYPHALSNSNSQNKSIFDFSSSSPSALSSLSNNTITDNSSSNKELVLTASSEPVNQSSGNNIVPSRIENALSLNSTSYPYNSSGGVYASNTGTYNSNSGIEIADNRYKRIFRSSSPNSPLALSEFDVIYEGGIPTNSKRSKTISSVPSLSLSSTSGAYLIENTNSKALMPARIDIYNAKSTWAKTTGFYLSGFYGINSTWIINRNAFAGEQAKNAYSNQIDFGKNYGLSIGYDFSTRWGIQLDYTINSEQKQDFYTIRHGMRSDVPTEVNLTYALYPLTAKYKFQRISPLTKLPMVLSCVAGVQYGVLKTAEINIDNPTIHNDLLKTSTWGWVAGLDYSLYMTPNYFLSVGFRSSISTPSSRATEINLPSKRTTNNLQMGIRASFNYRFSK